MFSLVYRPLSLYLFTSFRDIAPLLLSNAGKSLSLRSETNDLLTSTLFHSLHFTDQNVAKTIDGSTSSGGGVGSLKSLKFSFYLPSNEKEMTMLMNLLNITVGKLSVGKGAMGHEEQFGRYLSRGTSEPLMFLFFFFLCLCQGTTLTKWPVLNWTKLRFKRP